MVPGKTGVGEDVHKKAVAEMAVTWKVRAGSDVAGSAVAVVGKAVVVVRNDVAIAPKISSRSYYDLSGNTAVIRTNNADVGNVVACIAVAGKVVAGNAVVVAGNAVTVAG